MCASVYMCVCDRLYVHYHCGTYQHWPLVPTPNHSLEQCVILASWLRQLRGSHLPSGIVVTWMAFRFMACICACVYDIMNSRFFAKGVVMSISMGQVNVCHCICRCTELGFGNTLCALICSARNDCRQRNLLSPFSDWTQTKTVWNSDRKRNRMPWIFYSNTIIILGRVDRLKFRVLAHLVAGDLDHLAPREPAWGCPETGSSA